MQQLPSAVAGLWTSVVVAGMLSPTVRAQAPPAKPARVAVVAPLHFASNSADDRRLGEALGEILAVALADQKNLVVVERRRLTQVLDEQKLAGSGLVDPATAAKVGKLLGAELVVAGSIVDIDGKLRCAVQVVAVDGQRVLGSAQAEGPRKDLERIHLDLSIKLATIARVPLPTVKPEELDDSPVGRLHLMRGVAFFHAGNSDQAIASCLRAVRLDPRLQEARLWIARAYLRLDEKPKARAELRRLLRSPTAAARYKTELDALMVECGLVEKPK